MICKYCDSDIPEGRIEFLLEYGKEITCIDCTKEVKQIGFMDYGHKTAPQLVILPEDPEIKRIAKRAFCRAR